VNSAADLLLTDCHLEELEAAPRACLPNVARTMAVTGSRRYASAALPAFIQVLQYVQTRPQPEFIASAPS
jgi:hypothetical protein